MRGADCNKCEEGLVYFNAMDGETNLPTGELRSTKCVLCNGTGKVMFQSQEEMLKLQFIGALKGKSSAELLEYDFMSDILAEVDRLIREFAEKSGDKDV